MNNKYEYFDQLQEGRETADSLYNEMAVDVNLLLDSVDELQVRVDDMLDMNTAVYNNWAYLWDEVENPDSVDIELTDNEYVKAEADWEMLRAAADRLDNIHRYLRQVKKSLDRIDTDRWPTEES